MGGEYFGLFDGASTLTLSAPYMGAITNIAYESDLMTEGFFLVPITGFDVPANSLLTASGSATFANPFNSLFGQHAPGTVLVVIPGVLHFIIGGVPDPAAAAPAAGGGYRREQTLYLVDSGAISSLAGSGLPMGLVLRDVARGAADPVLRDLNDRLKRAQSRGLGGGESGVVVGGEVSLLRQLAFVGGENMSYKVAFGLADPEERTVTVDMADTLGTLDIRSGANFNGQSLGGGLPYAAMGVPLLPMAGGAATVQIVEAGGGKAVVDDAKAVVEAAPWKRWELFAAGDFSFYDQDQLGDLMEGFDTDSYAGSVGLEYRAKEWLNLGLAWSYLQSDTTVSGNLGNIDLEGNVVSGYASVFWRRVPG